MRPLTIVAPDWTTWHRLPAMSRGVPSSEIDTSLVAEMLALTPAERIARHDQALDLVLALETAGRRLGRTRDLMAVAELEEIRRRLRARDDRSRER